MCVCEHECRPVGMELLHMGGRTNRKKSMSKLTVDFRNFVHSPKGTRPFVYERWLLVKYPNMECYYTATFNEVDVWRNLETPSGYAINSQPRKPISRPTHHITLFINTDITAYNFCCSFENF